MDVFAIHQRIIADYGRFMQSFVRIRDERIRTHVQQELDEGLLWPEPLLQVSPSYEPGHTVDELVALGKLHRTMREVFAIKSEDTRRKPLRRRPAAQAMYSPPAPARARAWPTSSRS